VPFTKCFPLCNLGEGGKAAESDIVNPFSRLADGDKQSIAAPSFHRRFCAGLMMMPFTAMKLGAPSLCRALPHLLAEFEDINCQMME
jgi:hypothetical protein